MSVALDAPRSTLKQTEASAPCTTSCQFVLNSNGIIVAHEENSHDKLGFPHSDLLNRSLSDVLASIHHPWKALLPDNLFKLREKLFLPWTQEGKQLCTGIELHAIKHESSAYLTIIPALAPHTDLKNTSIAELPFQKEAFAPLFLRLQTAESRLNDYMHNFPGIFFSQRIDLSFSYIGPAIHSLLGCEPRQFHKSSSAFLQLILDKDREYFLNEIQKHASSKETFTINYQLRHPRENSIIYIMDVRTPKISPSGLLLGYEGVLLDVSRQMIAEDRLTRATWKESLAIITNGLIHDFSNIMAGIYSISELYGSSLEENHPWNEGITQIKKNSRQAQQLVRRIIDLNREISGKRNFFNLETLIEDQIDLIKIILPKNTSLEFHRTNEELPVYLDDVRFRQTLLNLAMNSKDALGKNGQIKITVEHVQAKSPLFTSTPHPSLTPREGATISFEDNGCGIEPENLSKIFNPFFTTKESQKGSGFGLYNSKLLIEEAGGQIVAQSTLNKGTTFHIYLPLADFSELSNEPEENTFDEVNRPSLLVYCSKDASNFEIVNLIRNQAWEVIAINNAEDFKNYIQESPFLPDVIIHLYLGEDVHIHELTQFAKSFNPDIQIAVQAPSDWLKTIPKDLKSQYQLLLENTLQPQEALQEISKLI